MYMNGIYKFVLQKQYPRLENIDADEELLKNALSDIKFMTLYKKSIKTFIKHLDEMGIDDEIKKEHINAILKTYKKSGDKYISFVKENAHEDWVINNPQIICDENFDELYKFIGSDIFKDNIANVINEGHSKRLLEFLTVQYKYFSASNIRPELFDDKIWNMIKSDKKLGDTPIITLLLEKLGGNIDKVIKVLNSKYLDGMEYMYNTVAGIEDKRQKMFHDLNQGEALFFRVLEDERCHKIFDMNFINSIDKETLKTFYLSYFRKDSFLIASKIVEKGNYKLVEDLINYSLSNGSNYFQFIKEEDMTKSFIETSACEDKKSELLRKYFEIETVEVAYIQLFVNSINRIELPADFKEKYSSIINMLNLIYSGDDNKLIELSKKLDEKNKKKYLELIYNCEKEGNQLLKINFSKEILQRSEEMLKDTKHSPIKTKSGKKIEVYEFDGQPFTMLIHAIVNNKDSSNNEISKKLLENPELWNSVDAGNNHISTSIITNEYMINYGFKNSKALILGFKKIPPKSVKITAPSDTGVLRSSKRDSVLDMRDLTGMASVNTIATIDEIMKATKEEKSPNEIMWNEMVISRYDNEKNTRLQPDYIVCMDEVNEISKKAAEVFGVPIYLIHTKKYEKNQEVENIEEENNGRSL